MSIWGSGRMSKKWLHAVFVLPDERILLERLILDQVDHVTPVETKWAISIGVQSFGIDILSGNLNIHSTEVNTLSRIIFRRLGIDVLNSPGIQILHLFSHNLNSGAVIRMSHFTRTMEVFRIKAFKNIKLQLDGHSEVKALFKSEIMANLGNGMFDEESITTMNMIDAMRVNL